MSEWLVCKNMTFVRVLLHILRYRKHWNTACHSVFTATLASVRHYVGVSVNTYVVCVVVDRSRFLITVLCAICSYCGSSDNILTASDTLAMYPLCSTCKSDPTESSTKEKLWLSQIPRHAWLSQSLCLMTTSFVDNLNSTINQTPF